MQFDLTKEIKLDEKNQRLYQGLRAFLYAFCFSLLVVLAYLILFPTQEFNYSFISPNKGNVINPRDDKNNPIADGIFLAEQKNYFDASLVGSFSKIKISFTPDRQSIKPENYRINLRKSYKAFLYPDGLPAGFKNGTLVRNKDDYFLVSNDELRKFGSRAFSSALEFPEDAFVAIDDQAELQANPRGADIINTINYPADTLFEIEDNYYRLNKAGILEKFVSVGAFHSQYAENSAIPKSANFLATYQISQNPIGFADGSLVSYGASAYVVSGNKIYPIGDPDIFLNQGYDWNDLITIGGDEFSFYEKQKLFTLTSAHPDGTIFSDPVSGNWYLISAGQKHRLFSEKIARSWLVGKKPISISDQSLEILGNCDLKKELFGNYSCLLPLDDKKDTAGKYYEFSFTAKDDLKINNLNLLYEKNMTTPNLKLALRSMILKIKARYGIQSAPPQ